MLDKQSCSKEYEGTDPAEPTVLGTLRSTTQGYSTIETLRVLFTTQPAYGHFHPLVPLAQALQRQGHEVAVATSASFGPVVQRSDLRCLPAGLDWLEEGGGLARTFPELRRFDNVSEGNDYVVGEIFAHLTALETARDLSKYFGEWQPDVVVRETFEFGGALAAEMFGLPHATVQVGSFAAMERWREAASVGLAKARNALALPADPDLAMIYRHLLLSFVPPTFQDPDYALPATARVFQASAFDRSDGAGLPPWLDELAPQPHVFTTMGTVLHRTLPIFRATLDALAPQPLNVTLAVGHHQDPAQFGAWPDNVHIERYLPLSLMLPHCDLVINHGGFGTVMAALANGLPMVLIPQNADQHDNSRRCEALGVAKVIESEEPSAADLLDATLQVLGTPSFNLKAAALREEMISLPGLEEAVEALQHLGADDRKNQRHRPQAR